MAPNQHLAGSGRILSYADRRIACVCPKNMRTLASQQSTCLFAKVGEFVFLISRPVTAANSLACRHSIGCSSSKRIEGARGSGQLTDLGDGGGGGLLLAKREGHGGGRVGGGGAGESERKSELHLGVIIRQQGTIKVGGRYTTPRGAPAARQASETNARADDDVICGVFLAWILQVLAHVPKSMSQ